MKLLIEYEFLIALMALDGSVRKTIMKSLARLERAQEMQHKPLRGELSGWYKLRVGDWRCIYRIQEDETLVFTRLGHRSEIYEE